MSDIDVSVLIVTYNSRAFVGDCIESVARACTAFRYEIVCADNASVDGSASFVRDRYPDVTVIDMGYNAGFSKANNRALEAASGRHVLLLNGDAVLADGALDILVAFADAQPSAGVVAPRLENPDGTDQGTARAFPTPAAALFGRRSPLTRLFPNNRFARAYMPARDRTDGPFEVDWVSGACLMVPRAVVDEVGPLDPEFFMYWEDADWCRRIKAAGYSVWCVPSARARHAEGSSSQARPAAQVRHFHRSAYRYYAKHHLAGARRILRPLAAAALAARAASIITRDALRQRRAAPFTAEGLRALPDARGFVQ